MKEFSRSKSGGDYDAAHHTDQEAAHADGQDLQQRHAPQQLPLGMSDPLTAAKMGHGGAQMGMQALLGNAGLSLEPQPLAAFNPSLAARVAKSTGVDISDATVQLDPALDQQGKQGAAEAGARIYLAQNAQDAEQTLAHEAIHIVQGRGGSKKQGAGDTQGAQDPEHEAIAGARAVLAGEPFEVALTVGPERVYDDPRRHAAETIANDLAVAHGLIHTYRILSVRNLHNTRTLDPEPGQDAEAAPTEAFSIAPATAELTRIMGRLGPGAAFLERSLHGRSNHDDVARVMRDLSGRVAARARDAADVLADRMNRSNPLHDGSAPLELPAQAEIDALRDQAARFAALDDACGDPWATPAAQALNQLVVALYGARAVQRARGDWTQGYRETRALSRSERSSIEAEHSTAADRRSAAGKVYRGRDNADETGQYFQGSGYNAHGPQADANHWYNPEDWCGLFVVDQYYRASGLDGDTRSGMWVPDRAHEFFKPPYDHDYKRMPTTVWDADQGQWRDLHAYHQERGAERQWIGGADLQARLRAGERVIQAGDFITIDHDGKAGAGDAEHIAMVDSYDPSTGVITTVEGNIRTAIMPDADGNVPRDVDGQPQHTRISSDDPSSVGFITHHLGQGANPNAGSRADRSINNIHGVGRLSVVDFEDRDYAMMTLEQLRNFKTSSGRHIDLSTISPEAIRSGDVAPNVHPRTRGRDRTRPIVNQRARGQERADRP